MFSAIGLTLLYVWAVSGAVPIQLSAPTNYFLGTDVDGVLAGDINEDGKPDLATIGRTSYKGVTLWINQGGGIFTRTTNYTMVGNPQTLTSGDFNNDGHLDILTVNYLGGDTIGCLLGNGRGEFLLRSSGVTVNASVPGVAAGDFNGDGKLDVVMATYGIKVLLGLGTGYFSVFTNYQGPTMYAAAAADLNQDGKLDIVTGNYSSSSMSVYLGRGDGTFLTPTNYSGDNSEYHYAVAVGDFNGDTKPDLATVNQYYGSVSIRLNNGDGTFGPETKYRACLMPHALALGDLNGDGALDIVTASSGSLNTAMAILYGNGNGSFGISSTNFSGVYGQIANQGLVIADFDGDGRPDLVNLRTAAASLTVRKNESRPRLDIEPAGPNVKLTWPDWPVFKLQTCENGDESAVWVTDTNSPKVLNGRSTLTLEGSDPARFYRLMMQ